MTTERYAPDTVRGRHRGCMIEAMRRWRLNLTTLKPLRSRSQRGQIVVSTHSPYFVSWSDIQAGAKVYRTSLVENDGATIRTIEPKTIKKIGRASCRERV